MLVIKVTEKSSSPKSFEESRISEVITYFFLGVKYRKDIVINHIEKELK